MWAVVTKWQQRVRGIAGVGFEFSYHYGEGQLYRKARRADTAATALEAQFANDSSLFATSRAGAEIALDLFNSTASEFGLTVSATKTKFLVAGAGVTAADQAPIQLAGVDIECVPEFKYLGCIIHCGGRSSQDISARVASASWACGALQQSVCRNKNLDLQIKRCVFNAYLLSLLLYGSECWTPLKQNLRRMSVFHMRYVRSILGITRHRCWDDHISNNQLLEWWGDSETIVTKVQHRRLEWLGHVARMNDVQLSKQLLFGTLPSCRLAHGPRRRWKDCAVKDHRSRDLEADWYRVACDSRADWRLAYTSDAPDPLVPAPVTCFTCARHFARQGDLARHKCTAERQKPVSEQRGTCQCPRCHRWFRSRGGLAVHRCSASTS